MHWKRWLPVAGGLALVAIQPGGCRPDQAVAQAGEGRVLRREGRRPGARRARVSEQRPASRPAAAPKPPGQVQSVQLQAVHLQEGGHRPQARPPDPPPAALKESLAGVYPGQAARTTVPICITGGSLHPSYTRDVDHANVPRKVFRALFGAAAVPACTSTDSPSELQDPRVGRRVVAGGLPAERRWPVIPPAAFVDLALRLLLHLSSPTGPLPGSAHSSSSTSSTSWLRR